MLLHGSGGAGKTTALIALGRDLAARGLADDTAPAPAFGRLREWSDGKPALDWLHALVPPAVLRHPVAWLLDGLEEIPEKRHSELGAAWAELDEAHRVVVAYRSVAPNPQPAMEFATRATLGPLTKESVEGWLRTFGKVSFASCTAPALTEFLRVPLLLALFTEAEGSFERLVTACFRHEAARREGVPRRPDGERYTEQEVRAELGNLGAERLLKQAVRGSNIGLRSLGSPVSGAVLAFGETVHLLSMTEGYDVRFKHLELERCLALPRLEAYLRESEPEEVRYAAAVSLRDHGLPAVTAILHGLVNATDRHIRIGALKELLACGTGEAELWSMSDADAPYFLLDDRLDGPQPLIERILLGHRNHYVREWAAMVLGKQGTGTAALIAALPREEHEIVRRVMVSALAPRADPRAAEALGGQLRDDHSFAAKEAVGALEEIGGDVMLDQFARALERGAIQYAGRRSLNQVGVAIVRVLRYRGDPGAKDLMARIERAGLTS
jgi:hypothetical protein